MTGRAAIDIRRLVELLAGNAEALARELLPKGRRHGAEWVEASTAEGGIGDSLSVNIAARPGVWSHFATGAAGDALDLVAYVRFGGDKGKAVAWARSWLGLDGMDPARLRETRARAAAKWRDHEPDRSAAAFRLWLGCDEQLGGTPAELYLRARGIDLRRLGRWPRALRYHPRLRYTRTGEDFPAMVAAITGAGGKTVAVHRTYLEQVGGVWRKARVPADPGPKLSLGRLAGGAVRIWRGMRIDPETGEIGATRGGMAPRLAELKADARASVAVTEGLEDALTVALCKPDWRVWCAVSLANMGGLKLPPAIGEVVIVADNDAGNAAAQRGLNRAIEHFLGLGVGVKLAQPPAGVKDMNALISGETG